MGDPLKGKDWVNSSPDSMRFPRSQALGTSSCHPSPTSQSLFHLSGQGGEVFTRLRHEDFYPAECNEDAVHPTEQSEGAEAD
jgi:hypothetical protein